VSSKSPNPSFIFSQFVRWAIAAGLICLGLAVLNWGLQYKMSLYNEHPSTVSHTPAAKLWKEGGSMQSAQIPLPERTPVLPQVTCFIFVLALYLAVRNATFVGTLLNWRSHAHFPEIRLTPFREAFFFRPPPVNA
jgi:hypothetical protein